MGLAEMVCGCAMGDAGHPPANGRTNTRSRPAPPSEPPCLLPAGCSSPTNLGCQCPRRRHARRKTKCTPFLGRRPPGTRASCSCGAPARRKQRAAAHEEMILRVGLNSSLCSPGLTTNDLLKSENWTQTIHWTHLVGGLWKKKLNNHTAVRLEEGGKRRTAPAGGVGPLLRREREATKKRAGRGRRCGGDGEANPQKKEEKEETHKETETRVAAAT